MGRGEEMVRETDRETTKTWTLCKATATASTAPGRQTEDAKGVRAERAIAASGRFARY